MNITTLENGAFGVNTYLLAKESFCLIIDPGSGILPLLDQINNEHLTCIGIFITHPHIDHVEGIPLLKCKMPSVHIYISAEAVPHLSDIPYQARLFGLPIPDQILYDISLKNEGTIQIDSFSVQYFSTPGHCPGSLSFLIDGSLFTGDVLFKSSIGRTDLKGGSYPLLSQSITEKLFTLPESTQVYPGHGAPTSIGWEKKNNPYI